VVVSNHAWHTVARYLPEHTSNAYTIRLILW
jgi:hypothetical protein